MDKLVCDVHTHLIALKWYGNLPTDTVRNISIKLYETLSRYTDTVVVNSFFKELFEPTATHKDELITYIYDVLHDNHPDLIEELKALKFENDLLR